MRKLAVLTAVCLGLAGLVPAGAAAQPLAAPSTAGAGVASTTMTVVADGLNAPRKVLFDQARRRVLVAEAGIGLQNTGPCGYAERGLYMCLGLTGSIFQYSTSGAPSRRIVTGLPSTAIQALPNVVIGVHGLSLRDDRLTAVFGLLGNVPFRDSLGADAALMGQAVVMEDNGPLRPLADIVGFENGLTPGVEADPYGVVTGSYGTVVVNAGGPGTDRGNDLLLVQPNGTVSRLAQFPERPSLTNPSVNIRTVPTAVAHGPDGAFYVGELTGAPFYAGEARVWRVVPRAAPTVLADGFTTIIDLAFDQQGRLVVLQTGNNPFNTEQDGALIRIEADGQRTVLASAGLKNPGGLAIAGDGVFYVSTRTASGGGVGQLVEIRTQG